MIKPKGTRYPSNHHSLDVYQYRLFRTGDYYYSWLDTTGQSEPLVGIGKLIFRDFNSKKVRVKLDLHNF